MILLASDGTTIAWIEGVGYDTASSTWASRSLWSGTYDGTLHETRVRDINDRPMNDYFRAAAATTRRAKPDAAAGHTVYAVYRLADGTRAVFDPVAAGGPIEADRVSLVTEDEMSLDTVGMLWNVDPRTLTFE